jgi:hypothetical protein
MCSHESKLAERGLDSNRGLRGANLILALHSSFGRGRRDVDDTKQRSYDKRMLASSLMWRLMGFWMMIERMSSFVGESEISADGCNPPVSTERPCH